MIGDKFMESFRNSFLMEDLEETASTSLNQKRTSIHLACYGNKTFNFYEHHSSLRRYFHPQSFPLNCRILKIEAEPVTR